ncbi:hypothetical protein COOONC_12193 [Cooperia oncophora]
MPPEGRTRTSSIVSNYLHLDADKVLSAYGKFGRYQMITYLITNSVHILFAINMMVMPFITEDPKFECGMLVAPIITQLSDLFGRRLTFLIPLYVAVTSNLICAIAPNYMIFLIFRFVAGVATTDYTVVDKCTVLYNYSDTNHQSLASEFNLVCDNYESVEHGASVFMLGGMLVAPIITQLSDLFGRRLTFLIPLYVAVTSNLICAIAPNYMIFLIFRFVAGSGPRTRGVVAATENFYKTRLCFRRYSSSISAFLVIAGLYVWEIVALELVRSPDPVGWDHHHWRFTAVTSPLVYCDCLFQTGDGCISLFPFLDSLQYPTTGLRLSLFTWLITNRKNKGVSKYIRTSSRFNRVEIPLHECKSTSNLAPEGKKRTFFDMFKNPGLVVHLIMNSYILIVMNGTYWALSLFSTELSEDKMTGFFLSGLVEIPAGLIAIALLVSFNV